MITKLSRVLAATALTLALTLALALAPLSLASAQEKKPKKQDNGFLAKTGRAIGHGASKAGKATEYNVSSG